jgi:hypothetical protein
MRFNGATIESDAQQINTLTDDSTFLTSLWKEKICHLPSLPRSDPQCAATIYCFLANHRNSLRSRCSWRRRPTTREENWKGDGRWPMGRAIQSGDWRCSRILVGCRTVSLGPACHLHDGRISRHAFRPTSAPCRSRSPPPF